MFHYETSHRRGFIALEGCWYRGQCHSIQFSNVLDIHTSQVLEGSKVVERTGAVGRLRSVYCRDPDGNLIEVSNYV